MLRPLMLAVLMAACSSSASADGAPSEVRVSVTADGSGGRIAFDLPGDATVWAFPESAVNYSSGEPWRPGSWHVVTPGVRLVRRHDLDALVLDPGASRHVEIAFDLYSATLRAAYEPAIAFEGGDIALFTGQYQVAPLPNEAALDDLTPERLEIGPERITFRRPGAALLAHGRSAEDEISVSGGPRTYVFMGTTPLLETPDIAAVIDPGLPAWTRQAVRDFTPRLLAYFKARLGPGLDGRPTLFIAWGGGERTGLSLGGGALPGLITIQMSGNALLEETPPVLQAVRGVIAHEAAHFWLGQDLQPANSVTEAWVHEGGADAVSFRALGALGAIPDVAAAFQRSLNRCVRSLPAGPLTTAISRGDQPANYACGAVFHLTAETVAAKANPGTDLLDFWKALLDRSRAQGRFSQADWLALFRADGGGDEAAGLIARLAAEGSPHPADDLARLFDLTGVAYTRAEDGTLRLSPPPSPTT